MKQTLDQSMICHQTDSSLTLLALMWALTKVLQTCKGQQGDSWDYVCTYVMLTFALGFNNVLLGLFSFLLFTSTVNSDASNGIFALASVYHYLL